MRTRLFALPLVALLMALALIPAPDPVTAGAPVRRGDVNCDGAVQPVDGVEVLRSTASLSIAGAGCLDQRGDTDCNGDTNVIDALRILRFASGGTTSVPPGCTRVGGLLQPPPTSFDLIADALEASDIDADTAILYEFFAAFDDPRLPTEYRGDDTNVRENPALRKLPPLWDTLSQDTRDLLAPFLRTPAEPDSWYAPQGSVSTTGIEWGTVTAASHPVKVWWETRFPEDEERAQQIADAIDATIWQDLTGLMGKQPMPDCGAGCPSGGGDPALDIYLVASGANVAYTQWNPPDDPTCETTPAFMVMLRNESLGTVAHEFMHAIQFAYPYANGDGCDEYDWWWEATATWAEDVAYPLNNTEQPFAPLYLQSTHQPIEETAGKREYGAYMLPFYLARVKNLPSLISSTFEEFETETDSLEGIESAMKSSLITNGFDDIWADFQLKNWNRDPVTTYQDSDDLNARATAISQEVPVDKIEMEEAEVEHLAAVHYRFTFHRDARTIVFKNTLSGMDHASVWAIKKVRGEWKDPEDWSDETEKEFCRDRPSEDLSELIIIAGNSDIENKLQPPSAPTIEGKSEGCAGWEGSVTVEGFGMGGAFQTPNDTHNGLYMATTQGLRMEQVPGESPFVFQLVSGSVRWTASGIRSDSCGDTGTISGELNVDFASTIGKDRFSGTLFLNPFDPSTYSVNITGDLADGKETWDCPFPDQGFSGEHPWYVGQSLIPNRSESRDLPLTGEPGQRVAQGEITFTEAYDGFELVTYRWRFEEYEPE